MNWLQDFVAGHHLVKVFVLYNSWLLGIKRTENIYKFKNKLGCEFLSMFNFTQSQKNHILLHIQVTKPC